MNSLGLPLALRFPLFAIGIALIGGCTAQPNPSEPRQVIVEMRARSFEPKSVTIRVGESVLWRNTTFLVQHTVTADPSKAESQKDAELPPGADTFDSGYIPSGGTYRHVFTVPGRYRYFCEAYEARGMVAEVLVLTSAGTLPATEPAATEPAIP